VNFLREGVFTLGDIEWESSNMFLNTKDLFSRFHLLHIYRVAVIPDNLGGQNTISKHLRCAPAREGTTLLSYSPV
jgi:hypothetical protein